MPVYKNPLLVGFRKLNILPLIKYEDFEKLVNLWESKNWNNAKREIPNKYKKMLMVWLYFTGRRIEDSLKVKRGDIKQEGRNLLIARVLSAKKGFVSRVPISLKYPLARWFWEQIRNYPDDYFLFGWLNLVGNPRALVDNMTRVRIDELPESIRIEVIDILQKLGIEAEEIDFPDMFWRHHFSTFYKYQGATDEELKTLRGTKTDKSIQYYKHIFSIQEKKLKRIASKF